jgi:hypothetical protein
MDTVTTPSAPDTVGLFTTLDRCDRCCAQARVLALLHTGGELFFCGHHGRIHRPALEGVAVWIQDGAALAMTPPS